MSKLLMLKGLPASGKSTYSHELIKKGWKRVNKDLLREMFDGGAWSREREKHIYEEEEKLARSLIAKGCDVVVDDCSFAHQERWENVARELNAEFEVKFFDVPLYECIERDSKRGDKSVGAKVIMGMYEKYLLKNKKAYDPVLPDCYIFDIDGTLAHSVNRSPYDYTKVNTDTLDENVSRIFKMIGDYSKVTRFVMSGRESSCKEETKEWLSQHGLDYDGLYMREEGDSRKDAIVKKELYEKHVEGKFNVLGVFDDRNQVVDMWRNMGLTCFQVNYGFF